MVDHPNGSVLTADLPVVPIIRGSSEQEAKANGVLSING